MDGWVDGWMDGWVNEWLVRVIGSFLADRTDRVESPKYGALK